jgi:hypothetical protein
MPTNPLPLACVALGPVLPLVLLAGVGLAFWAARDRRTAAMAGPGVGIAAWVLCTHLIGRATQSFVPAFAAATVVLGIYGAAFAVRELRSGARWWQPWSGWMAMTLVALCVLVVPAASKHFHDELTIAGHLSTVAQLQNGWYPPRFSVFPEHEFRYHYGFDVLAAMLSGMFRLEASTAVDVATLGLWAYTIVLLGHVGACVIGTRHGATTAAVTLLAGGIPFFCAPPGSPLGHQLTGQCKVDGVWLNPPLSSYFFQHPFALGIPLGLVLVVLLTQPRPPRGLGRYVVYALCLCALAVSHMVIFVTFGMAVSAAECFRDRKFEWRRLLAMFGTLVAAGAMAVFSGGFFLPHPSGAPDLVIHLGVTNTLGGTLEWLARSFGLLLPIGLIGLLFLRRERLFLWLLVLGSLSVLLFTKHPTSWNVTKFATVASLALGVGASAVCVRLWQVRSQVSAELRAGFSVLAIGSGIGATVAGWAFHLAIWSDLEGARYEGKPVALAPDDVAVAEYLRRHMRDTDVVYRNKIASYGYNQWPGFMSRGRSIRQRSSAMTMPFVDVPICSAPYQNRPARGLTRAFAGSSSIRTIDASRPTLPTGSPRGKRERYS